MFYNHKWSTVCDDSFSNSEAMVVCKQLRYAWYLLSNTNRNYADSLCQQNQSYLNFFHTCSKFKINLILFTRLHLFFRTGAIQKQNSPYGPGKGTFVVDSFNCVGSETALARCDHISDSHFNRTCSHTEDVGIICCMCFFLIRAFQYFIFYWRIKYVRFNNQCTDKLSDQSTEDSRGRDSCARLWPYTSFSKNAIFL